MPADLTEALSNAGPHSVASLAERLPHFPREALREALEALAEQGVLAREEGPDGETLYRYLDPARYQQANLDVVRDPGTGIRRRPR